MPPIPCGVAFSRLAFPALAFVALAAALAGEVWGLRSNTLERNGRWHSAKLDLERPVIGAVSFVVTPLALHGSRLDLGAWHGFQQLAWHEPIDATRIELRFQLAHGAHLSLLYGGVEGGFAGVRLSRHPSLPAREFLSLASGRVAQSYPFELALGEGWHRATLELGERTRLRIDDRELPLNVTVGPGPKRFALRGSALPTRVDDIRIELRDGRVLREDFRRAGGLQRALVCAALLLLAIETVVRLRSTRDRSAAMLRLGLALSACAIAGLALATQRLYLGRVYPAEVESEAHANRIETPGQAIARLRAARDERAAILVLGGSQTWGAGAARAEDVWSEQIERSLGGRYKVWNAGVSGQDAAAQISLLRQHGLALRPRLVIAVFGTNDADPDAFSRSLDELASIGRDADLTVLLVQEPTAADAPALAWSAANRERVREAAERHGLALVDVHSALVKRRDQALMWWDFAHLSSHGHTLFAQEILPAIEQALAAQPNPDSGSTP
jgi:lysophospholipase L1-like esterase